MKKYIAFTFLLFLTFFLCGCSDKKHDLSDLEKIKKRGYLIVGVKGDSPPFGYYDKNGYLAGIDIELAKQIANNIFRDEPLNKKNIELVEVTAQNRFLKLNNKEVDMLVAIISVNEKRKLIIDFSAPYFTASQKIMVNKESKISHLQYFNTNGTIAFIPGTTGDKILRLAAPNARVVPTKTYTEAINLLEGHRVDAVLGDDCVLEGFNKTGKFKLINRAYSKEYYAVAVRKSDDSTDLLNEINATISSFLDSKSMNVLKKEFMGNKKQLIYDNKN